MKRKWKVSVLPILLSTFVALNGITAFAKVEPIIDVSARVQEDDVTVTISIEKSEILQNGRDSVKITAKDNETGNILVKTLWLNNDSMIFEESFTWYDVYNGKYTLKAEYSGDKNHDKAAKEGEDFEVTGYERPSYSGPVGDLGNGGSDEESSGGALDGGTTGGDGVSGEIGSGTGGATVQPEANDPDEEGPDYGRLTMDPIKGLMGSKYGIITANYDDHRSHWVLDELSALIWGGSVDDYWKLQYRDGSYAKGSKAVDEHGKQYENYHWEFIDQKWRAFDSNGFSKLGWIYDENYDGWFYLHMKHGMQTGWICVGDKWYYMNPDTAGCEGKMYAAQWTPDGYYVDESGAWDGRPQMLKAQ